MGIVRRNNEGKRREIEWIKGPMVGGGGGRDGAWDQGSMWGTAYECPKYLHLGHSGMGVWKTDGGVFCNNTDAAGTIILSELT